MSTPSAFDREVADATADLLETAIYTEYFGAPQNDEPIERLARDPELAHGVIGALTGTLIGMSAYLAFDPARMMRENCPALGLERLIPTEGTTP